MAEVKKLQYFAGGEWLDTFFNLGIKGNAVLYLAEKINNLGIECSHFSCGAGVAFEAWEKGVLGPDRTNGLKLEWGNVDAVDKLLDMAARREGWLDEKVLGDICAVFNIAGHGDLHPDPVQRCNDLRQCFVKKSGITAQDGGH